MKNAIMIAATGVAAVASAILVSGAFPGKDSDKEVTRAAQVEEYVQPDTETETIPPTTEAAIQPKTVTKEAKLERREFPIPEYEITDKTSCYHKLLNCVDYYNAAAGKIETNILNGYLSTIEYNVDMCEGTGYQHVLADDFDEEVFVGDGEVRTEGHIHNNSLLLPAYRKSGGERTIEDDEKRISTLDGEPCYTYRQNVTNLHYASTVSIFPQEMAFGFLGNKELWDITGRTEYLGREVVIVSGVTSPSYGAKLNINNFTMTIDCKTGIMLKFEGYDYSGNLSKYITTTEFTDEISK